MSLKEMMTTGDEKILSYVPDYKVNLIEPARMTSEEIGKFQSTLREVFRFIKYAKDKNKLMDYVQSENRLTSLDVDAAKVIKVITGSNFDIPEGVEEVNVCQAEMEWGRELKEEGRTEGINQLAKLLTILTNENRFDDIKKVANDAKYRDKLIKEFNLNIQS